MTDGLIQVTIVYHHPDNVQPTEYGVLMRPETLGTILTIMDELVGADEDEVNQVNRAVRGALG